MGACAAVSEALRSRLLASFERIETIDTHEHIIPEAERTSSRIDFFTLCGHYALNDVISAGLTPEAQQLLQREDRSDADKWRAFEPSWQAARLTSYGEALRIAIGSVYGFREISAKTLPAINEAIANRNKPGLYADILKKRARLAFCVNDEYWQSGPAPVDRRFFVLARKFDQWVTPITRAGLQRLEQQAGKSIGRLSDLKRVLEDQFRRAIEAGMVTVKTTIAYQRDLRFDEASEADASRDFEGLLQDATPPPEGFRALERRPYRRLSNHMMHHLIGLADAHKIPVQIHTGMQAGNGNFVTNSRPTDLTTLFFLFPRVAFDLFHTSYPWLSECAVLAKTFPNVHADFCWTHIISRTAAVRALHEMLDTVPANKIFGFGGDYRYPELSYAHLVMARRNIVQTLAERVEAHMCTEEEAATVGRWLLHDNPARLFSPKQA